MRTKKRKSIEFLGKIVVASFSSPPLARLDLVVKGQKLRQFGIHFDLREKERKKERKKKKR